MSAKTFYQIAGKRIKEIVQPYGFKKNGRFFYRITEEGVVQQFCLLWLHNSFTLRFYLSSIYNDNWCKTEGEEIYELINGTNNQWLCDHLSNSQINPEGASDICIQAVKDILLPFFESHKDPRSAKDFVVKYNPCAASDIYKYDIRELGLYLCIGDLDFVQEFLVHYIENSDRYNKSWWRTVEQEYHQLLDAICTGDREYISLYMDQKKNATYLEYKWKRP